jgi:hypothetical protein
LRDPISKIPSIKKMPDGGAQVVERLLSKCEALSSSKGTFLKEGKTIKLLQIENISKDKKIEN